MNYFPCIKFSHCASVATKEGIKKLECQGCEDFIPVLNAIRAKNDKKKKDVA